MGSARPSDPDLSQDEQAQQLTDTGNGPTVETEEQLLAEMYGEPDENGVYGAPEGGES